MVVWEYRGNSRGFIVAQEDGCAEEIEEIDFV
jgi:hypothetical protein